MGANSGGAWGRVAFLTASLLVVMEFSACAQEAPSADPPVTQESPVSAPEQPASEPKAAPPTAEAAEPSADGADPASADEKTRTDGPINFAADVRPILAMHCLKCHDEKIHRGGLALDSRSGAKKGGDSGQPILGGTLETNELYARVSSDERSYRMPKNAEALPPAEVETIRRWVEQGSSWPEPVADMRVSYLSYLEPWVSMVERYEEEYQHAKPFMIGFLLLQVLVLVVLRCRAAYRKGRPWTQGSLAPFCRCCDRVRGSEILLLSLLAICVVAAALGYGHYLKINRELAKVTVERNSVKSPWVGTVYGYPPKPVRPRQPKQVSGTYYRGNCERNEALFNGGNYLTSTFHVRLCDRAEQPINVGDPIPADGVYLRCEIERAPGTADQLFSPEGMGSVLFSKEFAEAKDGKVDEAPIHLETMEADQRWVATMPLGKPDATGGWSGVIYVYTGKFHEGDLSGTLHYGIGYYLGVTDGKLSAESDVWMDSFGNHAFAPPAPSGLLPYQEWFGTQPLPVITGENSKDPKLLGIDEHIQKGFIKPPPEKPAPEKSSPEQPQPDPAPADSTPPESSAVVSEPTAAAPKD
jgi:hypothetical protein